MKQIDEYSYQCGVMDCFNEMVKAGLKPIALAHPFRLKSQRDSYIPFVQRITEKYHTHYYLDDDPLITDLFPYSMTLGTFNIIFYKKETDIEEYEKLKAWKALALKNKECAVCREAIAVRFGELLGYKREMIREYIDGNTEKEEGLSPELPV